MSRPTRPTCGFARVASSDHRLFGGGPDGSVGTGACRPGRAVQRRPHEHHRRPRRQLGWWRGASGTGFAFRRGHTSVPPIGYADLPVAARHQLVDC
ncbi:hypothetical protein [Micromonospora coerulea]|uniref:hypothetical protein n=1 Tax=Micromonospora coerulea TaxID=47856 RepID=UPI0031F9D3EC